MGKPEIILEENEEKRAYYGASWMSYHLLSEGGGHRRQTEKEQLVSRRKPKKERFCERHQRRRVALTGSNASGSLSNMRIKKSSLDLVTGTSLVALTRIILVEYEGRSHVMMV